MGGCGERGLLKGENEASRQLYTKLSQAFPHEWSSVKDDRCKTDRTGGKLRRDPNFLVFVPRPARRVCAEYLLRNCG